MKFFENKKIWKKIVIMLLVIMFFQFALMVIPVQAAPADNADTEEEADDTSFGGILLSPIISLLVGLGDRNNGIYTQYSYGTR